MAAILPANRSPYWLVKFVRRAVMEFGRTTALKAPFARVTGGWLGA